MCGWTISNFAACGRILLSASALRCHGQANGKTCSFAYGAFHANTAVVGLDDVPTRRQPKSRTTFAAGIRTGLGGEERIKDPGQHFRGNARPEITDLKVHKG